MTTAVITVTITPALAMSRASRTYGSNSRVTALASISIEVLITSAARTAPIAPARTHHSISETRSTAARARVPRAAGM